MKKFSASVYLLFGMMLLACGLQAQTTWTGTNGTSWADAGNWSAGVPDAADDVTIPDVTNNPIIAGGTVALAKSLEVQYGGALTISALASLTMNGSKPYGFYSITICLYNEGTIENSGQLIIGNTSGTGQYGIINSLGTFNNKLGGEIQIDRASGTGLRNEYATFTNDGKITIGANSVMPAGIQGEYSLLFLNNATGDIKIDNTSGSAYIEDFGVSKNYGKITIGANSSSTSLEGIHSDGTFYNYAGGEIKIDNISSIALRNIFSFFYNYGKITIGANSAAGATGITNANYLVNETSGEIKIDRTANTGIYSDGDITNKGKITLGAIASVGTIGINNFAGTFNNSICSAVINIQSNSVIINEENFTNAGLIIENASGNSSISSNTGIIQNLAGGTFTTGGTPAITFAGTLSACCPSGNTLFVNASATGANNGTSWADAYTSLQSALNSTCSGITQIWVAKGTYYPDEGGAFANNDRNNSFRMKNGVAIYGGFPNDGTGSMANRNWTTNPTILSGEIQQDNNINNNSYHVIFNPSALGLNNTAILDGFTITAGHAFGGDGLPMGGGMYNQGASPSITNCSFVGNQTNSTGDGGGMYNSSSSPSLVNCSFSGNQAYHGGGMLNYASSPSLTNCSFSGNQANNGGGMLNENLSSPSLTNCSFLGNVAYQGGGGMYSAYSAPILRNCSFSGNQATNGGGMLNVSADPLVSPSLKNCILWGNSSEVGNVSNSSPTYTNTLVKGLVAGGFQGTEDPLFVNQPPVGLGTTGNLRLQACSPTIDAGSDAANTSTIDLDGNPRKFDAITGGSLIDMGAYEYQQTVPFTTWYSDADGDSYGTGTGQQFCSNPGTGWANRAGDCNDAVSSVNPGATEVCDGIDNDCDGLTDEGVKTTWYLDADGDGYYTSSTQSCTSPGPGYTTSGLPGDCNDNPALGGAAINPGAAEVCDGVDNNCNGNIDEGVKLTWYKDTDNDGYSDGTTLTQCNQPSGYKPATGLTAISGDCNDDNAAINPGAAEICDGVDNNCNGNIDEGVKPTWYKDTDNDGYSDGTTLTQCNQPSGYKPATGLTAISGDCNDADAAIKPGATEVCDGKDNNCDGTIDEGCARTWYFDFDKDGYGNRNKPLVSVTKPSKYVDNGDDCMDWLANVHPKADELPDNIDNDCDGEVDEGLPCRKKWYFDKDRDGYGNPNVPFRWSCIPMDEYIDNNLDCRDWDASVNPGATEIKDGKDNDCDGLIDEDIVIVGIDNGKQPEATKPLAMTAEDATGLGVRLWPNPARDVLMVTLDAFVPNQKMELTLMQADGKVQTAQSLTPTVKGQQVKMDVSRSAAGLYLLQVKQGMVSETKRAMIIR